MSGEYDEIIQKMMDDQAARERAVKDREDELKKEGYVKRTPKNTPPSLRDKRWVTVAIRDITYAKLKEMTEFYDKPLSKLLSQLIDQAFEKALRESKK
jgi:hypothetical protein